MRVLMIGMLLGAVLSMAALPAMATKCENGSGDLVKKERTVNGFTAVELTGSFEVVFVQANKIKLEVEAEENLHELIVTESTDQVLRITTAEGKCIGKTKGITIYVTGRSLEMVRVTGSGSFTASSLVECSELEMELTGSGDIVFEELEARSAVANLTGSGDIKIVGKGRCSGLEAHVVGSGDFKGSDFPVAVVEAFVDGSGDCEVNATERLTAGVFGSGDIRYKGNPEVKQRVTGSGSISKM